MGGTPAYSEVMYGVIVVVGTFSIIPQTALTTCRISAPSPPLGKNTKYMLHPIDSIQRTLDGLAGNLE